MFMFLMLCQYMHWKVCRLTTFHFILCTVWVYHNISNTIQSLIVFFLCCIMIRLSIPPLKKIVFNSSAFSLFCLHKYQAVLILTIEEGKEKKRKEKKEEKKKGGREREREGENMSQSNNNGLQIFWLVKSYSLIVITVQRFFPTQNMQPARHCASNLH